MSLKRTSTEEGGAEQDGGSIKHGKLNTSGDTRLKDLPLELLERIFENAITMEVHQQKLSKHVWRIKAQMVIRRLRCVCIQWNCILRAELFRNRVYKIFDDTDRHMISMEVLLESRIFLNLKELGSPYVSTLKEEVFVMHKANSRNQAAVHVYDRNNTNVMKDVIWLVGVKPGGIAVCASSSRIFVLDKRSFYRTSVLQIKKEGEHEYSVTTILSDLWMPNPTLAVGLDGYLILTMEENTKQIVVVTQFDANFSVQHEIRLLGRISKLKQVISKPNGNYMLISACDRAKTLLTEVDRRGNIIRQHQSPVVAGNTVCKADIYGRIFAAEGLSAVELLDSEFNNLEFRNLMQAEKELCCQTMYFDSERNEVVALVKGSRGPLDVLTIFRFRDE